MSASKTKPANRLGTETVTASVTPGIYALIQKLTDTHYFGRTENETASLILAAEVKRLALTGEIDNLISKAPTVLAPSGGIEDGDGQEAGK
jgi:hypothetical protein